MKTISHFLALIMCAFIISACTSSGKLEYEVAASAAECPFAIDEITTCVDIFTENKNVIYKLVIDETDFTIQDINNPEGKSSMKENLLLNLLTNDDTETQDFLKWVKEAKYNIIYRYIGASTGESMDVTIYNHEL